LEVQRIVLVEPVGETVPLRDQYLHGPWQNSAFMVAPDGSIVYAARWLKADALETFLETYLASGGKCHPVASEGPP
jgi:hypothetical protein